MIDFGRARKVMVDNQLRTSGITDRRLLTAMGEVPREAFVPGSRHGLAYIDDALPLSATRKLGAPAPFARLVQLAAIEHTDRVLDLGCASGYSAAVLARLAASVVAVDEDAALAASASSTLARLGVANVEVIAGAPATAGVANGPYDVIVVEGAFETVPDAFFAQLKPNGRLVALIAPRGKPEVAHLFVKSGTGVAATPAFDARLPPLSAPESRGFVF
jgi:protein-L-isoaspartate(D-aspartate) O-methyltransferase